MIWLLTKIFAPLLPLFHFIGDHRYGSIAVLLLVAAVAAWAYLPAVGAQTAKLLLVAAVALGCFDWGYSHRAAIDREAWAVAENERVRLGLIEHARRNDEIAKARREAELAEIALKSQQEEHARFQREIEDASKANDHSPCIDAAGVMRLDKIGARRKKAK